MLNIYVVVVVTAMDVFVAREKLRFIYKKSIYRMG